MEASDAARSADRIGPDLAALVADAAPLLEACARRFSSAFFTAARSDPATAAVLNRLSDTEFDQLLRNHLAHLTMLTSSQTSESEVSRRAYEGGRIHALIGIGTGLYASALAEYRQAVVASLSQWATRSARIAVWGVVNQRVFVDLQAHLAGHMEVAGHSARVALAIGEAATRAATVADLAREVLQAFTTLPGFAVGYFGRPNTEGIFQFEVGAGDCVDAFLSAAGGATLPPADGALPSTDGALPSDASQYGYPITAASESMPHGQGPSGRAWRSGTIVRSDSYQHDPTTSLWHEVGRRYGFRASVAIPLTDAEGRPRALITLYARWPGFFAEDVRQHLTAQARQLVEAALLRIEARQELTSGFSDIAKRSAHIALLASGAVTMLYQPIIDLRSGRLVKVEALARLRQPDRLISPGEFLPSFGEQELWRLFEIGLDQCLAALGEWERRGLVTHVSLNLPATFALTHQHGDAIEAALRNHGVDPARLTLEVLETGAIEQETTGYRQVLGRIQHLGVRIAQDDLGTAYSSLLRLRYLPFDEVKIAQELILDSGNDPRETWGFIQPLADLVHQLGSTVTVEGLETPGLVEAAVYLGADHGQGYSIARPMAADDVAAWAREFRLNIDPSTPATDLGALAAHLAWEQRLGVFTGRPHLALAAAGDPCPLTDYLEAAASDSPGHIVASEAHREFHRAALRGEAGGGDAGGGDAGGGDRQSTWASMTALLRH